MSTFSGKDLAKIVKPGGDLVGIDTSPSLNDNDAQQVIMERLSGLDPKWGAADTEAGVRDLAEIIVDALPQDLKTAGVLVSIDIRPYLTALDGKTINARFSAGITVPVLSEIWGDLGSTGTQSPRKVATKSLVDLETKRISDAFTQAGDTEGATKAATFDPKTAGVNPIGKVQTDPTAAAATGVPGSTTTQQITGVDANGDAVYGTIADTQGSQGFPANDMYTTLTAGIYDLQGMAVDEAKQSTAAGGGYYPVQINRPTARKDAGTISVTDALAYLYKLKPSQVADMQHKLAAAGYLDELGTSGGYLEGSASDANTQAAWKAMLKESIVNKTSVPATLGNRIGSYRDKIRSERLGQLSQYDPLYAGAIANDYAQSRVGRDLSADELTQLDGFLHTLTGNRAGYVAGATDNQAGSPLPNSSGYTQNDVEGFLSAKLGREERVVNNQAISYQLRKAMK